MEDHNFHNANMPPGVDLPDYDEEIQLVFCAACNNEFETDIRAVENPNCPRCGGELDLDLIQR